MARGAGRVLVLLIRGGYITELFSWRRFSAAVARIIIAVVIWFHRARSARKQLAKPFNLRRRMTSHSLVRTCRANPLLASVQPECLVQFVSYVAVSMVPVVRGTP